MPPGNAAWAAAADGGSSGVWRPFTRSVVVDGTRIRVATCGEGPPLLLVNGIGGNIEMWQPLAARLRNRQLIMFDVPGTGQSPPLLLARRMRGYARLLAGLLDTIDIERADVLGYSWGGALAQELAHQFPERVRSLVLAATIPGLGGQPPAPWVLALMVTPTRYYSRTYLRLVSPVVFGSDPAKAADSPHGRARRVAPPSLLGYSQQLYAITGWSSRCWLHNLRVPTLVLAGDRDPLAPRRNARILARSIPDARLHVVHGGHLFLLEEPEEAGRLVAAFLAELDGAVLAQGGSRSST
jgi:poly(3-hydroxyalkanoate) depolymerase